MKLVVALAGRRAEPFAAALAEAIVNAARLERRALSFYSSIEAAIRRALGQPAAAGALTSEQLASVFGPSPARYLGQLVAISVAIGDGHIAYSAAPRGCARSPCPSRSTSEHSHVIHLVVRIRKERSARVGDQPGRGLQRVGSARGGDRRTSRGFHGAAL